MITIRCILWCIICIFFLQVEVQSQTYPTNCDYSTVANIDCQPPFQFYTGFDTDFHVGDCNVSSITPTGKLEHYRKSIQYTTDVRTSNVAIKADPNGTTITLASRKYISYISFWFKGVGVDGTKILSQTNAYIPLFLINNNVVQADMVLLVYIYKGLPAVSFLSSWTVDQAAGTSYGGYETYKPENLYNWNKFEIVWVSGSNLCYRIYMNGQPVFAFPFGYTGYTWPTTCSGIWPAAKPFSLDSDVLGPGNYSFYYPTTLNGGPGFISGTNTWQILDLYIYSDIMTITSNFPNSNYNYLSMDLLSAKSYACGPRYGFGSGCKPPSNNVLASGFNVTTVYQHQSMTSLAGVTQQETNGLKRYLLFADTPFMNDNVHTENYNTFINYYNNLVNSEVDMILSFRLRLTMVASDSQSTYYPILMFRSQTNRKLISLYSRAEYLYMCLSLYTAAGDFMTISSSDGYCYMISNSSTVSKFGYSSEFKQAYLRISFTNSMIYKNNSYVAFGTSPTSWSLITTTNNVVTNLIDPTISKTKMSKNGLYVAEYIKDLYWYQPPAADISTRDPAKIVTPWVYDNKLTNAANLLNSSYQNSNYTYPLNGRVVYNTSTLNGYFVSPQACLGNCAIYTKISSNSLAISYGNSTSQPSKTCLKGFANINIGCAALCFSNDSRADGLCLTGTQCYCPFGVLQADGASCDCPNKSKEYGSSCSPCRCDNSTSICNSGLKGNGQCVCSNSNTMSNYTFFDNVSQTTLTACQCTNMNYSYGAFCNNTCAPYIAPVTCSTGVLGNGLLTCDNPKKQLEMLVDGVSYCQCKDTTKQYGVNCTDCTCNYPAVCKGGITGSGDCICPSYTFAMSLGDGRQGCECMAAETYGPFCASCNCSLAASCNKGINGTGSCYCDKPGYTLNQNGNGCDCPPNYYGVITNAATYSDNGLCMPCPPCPYGTTCSQGRSGNGTCVTLPGYKCNMFCGTQLAEVNCADPNTYGMDCTGVCPNCNHGSSCTNGTTGDGKCRKWPGFYCVSNCDKPNGVYDCTDPSAYGDMCQYTCPACPTGTLCDNGYRGTGVCIVLPDFILVPGTEANPVYDCKDPNRWSTSCDKFCPSSCPYGSRCSNGTMGTGSCIAMPNFEMKDANTFDCVDGKVGLGCMRDCPVCPYGSFCPSGIDSQGVCLPLPYFRKINDTFFDCVSDRFGPLCQVLCTACTDPYGYCDSGIQGSGNCLCASPTVKRMDGACDCPVGKSGASCLLSCPYCDANSTCHSGLNGTNQCICNGNLTRSTTSSPCNCPDGYYGSRCQHKCDPCFGGTVCHQGINGTGLCVCLPGQKLVNGQCECENGLWGKTCQYTCPNCTMYDSRMFCSDGKNGTGSCFCAGTDNLVLYQSSIFATPKCQCDYGWTGSDCLTPAPIQCAPVYKYYYYPNNTYYCDCFEGLYNTTCNSMCPSCSALDPNSVCDYGMHGSGLCTCKSGYIKNELNRCVCPPGKYQVGCTQTCKSCADPNGFAQCNDGESGDGSCICPSTSMDPHYNSTGSFLGCVCKSGFYGTDCSSMCYENCRSKDVNSICNDGMQGDGLCKCTGNTYLKSIVAAIATCECQPGFYGTYCNNTCHANYTIYDHNAYCMDGTKGNGSVACRSPYVITSYFPLKCDCPANRSGINCDIIDQVCQDRNARVNTGMYGDGKCYCDYQMLTHSGNGTDIVSCLCHPNYFGSSCQYTCPPCQTYHKDMYCLEGLEGSGICVCNPSKLLTLNYSSLSMTGKPSCQCKSGYGGDPCTLLEPPPPCAVNETVKLHSNGSWYCDCLEGSYGPACDNLCPASTIENSYCLDGKWGNGTYACKLNTYSSSRYDVGTDQWLPVCKCNENWFGPECNKFCDVSECSSDPYKFCNPNTAKCECKFPLVPYKGYCECPDKIAGYHVFSSACQSCFGAFMGTIYPNPHVQCNSGSLGDGAISCSDPDRFTLITNSTSGLYECVCKSDDFWGPDCLPCPKCNATDSRVTCNRKSGFCQCPSTHFLRTDIDTNTPYCECPHGYTGDQCQTKIITAVDPCPYINQIKVANLTDGTFLCVCKDDYIGETCDVRKPAAPCLPNQIRVVNVTDNTSQCQCKHGYVGPTCDQFLIPDPCGQNQVRVVNMTNGSTYCRCIDMYTGENCTQLVILPDCRPNSLRIYNYFTGTSDCQCMQGWTGVNCTEKIIIPSCGINQIRIVTNFTDGASQCVCMEGWTGPSCTDRIPIAPCGFNQVRLVNLSTGFSYCDCLYGWRGPACDERVPLDPCGVNAIRVVDTVTHEANCQCVYGRTGLPDCTTFITPVPCPLPNQRREVDPNDITQSICVCNELFTGADCSIFKGDALCPTNAYTILDPSTQGLKCACKVGWGGNNCDESLNYDGCPIQGKQILVLDPVTKAATCQCKPEWKGSFCETPRNDIQCSTNQIAVVNEVTFQLQCQCKENWGGVDCLSPVLPPVCPSNSVLTANYTTGEVYCKCASQREGENCEIYIPSVSCPGENSITLLDPVTGNLSCGCRSLWSGPNCTVPAVSSLCPLHANAVVSPINSTISCQCMPGYTGALCDEVVNTNPTPVVPLCTPEQFLHFNVLSGKFSCVCIFGKSGDSCEFLYTLPTCTPYQNLVFNSTSSMFYCSCINGTYGQYCNETTARVVEVVRNQTLLVNNTVFVDKIIEVNNTIVVNNTVFVDKIIEVNNTIVVNNTVFVDKIVEVNNTLVVNNTVYVDKVVLVNNTVFLNNTVYIERIVTINDTVYIEKVVQVNNTVYIDREVYVNQTIYVNNTILVNVTDENLNKTITDSQTTDAIGLSKLSTGQQVAAVVGYTAGTVGLGVVVTGVYYMLAKKATEKVASKIASGAIDQLMSSSNSDSTDPMTNSKQKNINTKARKNRKRNRIKAEDITERGEEEDVPLIESTGGHVPEIF